MTDQFRPPPAGTEPTGDAGPSVTAALELAASGWSVVPVHTVVRGRCSCGRSRCPSSGKHPRLRWEPAMHHRATPAELVAWWERWPTANIGVVTGWVSALVVLDVDPRHGGDERLAALEADHGPLPETVAVESGGGGRHLYFAHPPHLVPSRPLAAGVDLKAEGGMVVAPPSRHVSGGHYRWSEGRSPGEHRLRPLPAWLEQLAISLTGADDGSGRLEPWNPIVRTPAERDEFARLWASLGVELAPEEFLARCPLHDDHRPSLHIDPGGCRWFCFGCRRGGGLQALRRVVEPDHWPGGRPVPPVGIEGPPTLAPEVPVDVVGESAHQDELLALTGGRRTWSGAHQTVLARLEPEDDNPFDADAVAVRIGDHPVGHLPRDAAGRYRPLIERTIATSGEATCRAEIRGGWERSGGDVGRFGVVLSLPQAD